MKKTICFILLMILFLSMAADTMAGGMWSSTSRVIELDKDVEWINAETSAETITEQSGEDYSESRRMVIVSEPIRIELPLLPSHTSAPGGEAKDEVVDDEENHTSADGEKDEVEYNNGAE